MVLYGGDSVCTLIVENLEAELWPPYPWGKSGCKATVKWNLNIPSQMETRELQITFRVNLEYHDHPWVDHGYGYFEVWLDVLREGNWVQVDHKHRELGEDREGDWTGEYCLEVSHTMEKVAEMYQVRTRCCNLKTEGGDDKGSSARFTCVQKPEFIGDMTLDFIPLSIIYCPPGQNMSNTLSQTREYATSFTVGNTSLLSSSEGKHAGVAILGILTIGGGCEESQSVGNEAQSGMEMSEFRRTAITADNCAATRDKMGPLGDLFVILVNPKFSVSKRPDGTFVYEHKDCDQVLIVPAHKLLRPGEDQVVGSISAEDRMRLLKLDPFLKNLNLFIPPDNGNTPLEDTPLEEAANPYADPTANFRAEPIGLWHFDQGTKLDYRKDEVLELIDRVGGEIKFETTMRGEAAYNLSGAIWGEASVSRRIEVGIQWSREVKSRISRSASCCLLKKQDDVEPYALRLFYDRNFGTIMFQKVDAAPIVTEEFTPSPEPIDVPPRIVAKVIRDFAYLPWPQLPIVGFPDLTKPDMALSKVFPDFTPKQIAELVGRLKPIVLPNKSACGIVTSLDGRPVLHEKVRLFEGESLIRETVTDGRGRFRLDNLFLGDYTIQVGDQTLGAIIKKENLFQQPAIVEVKNVKQILDLYNSPIWKVQKNLELTSDNMRRLRLAIQRYSVFDEDDLSAAIQKTGKEFSQIVENLKIEFPKKPLSRITEITPEQRDKLEAINISSVLNLWIEVKKKGKLEEIAEKTGIDKSTISKWISQFDSNRAIAHKEILESLGKVSFLRRLLRFIRLIHLH